MPNELSASKQNSFASNAVANTSRQAVGAKTSVGQSTASLPSNITGAANKVAKSLSGLTPQAAPDKNKAETVTSTESSNDEAKVTASSGGGQFNVDRKTNEVDEKITNAAVKNS